MSEEIKRFFTGLFIGLLIGNIIINIMWITENRAISGKDVPNHLLCSIEFFYKASDIFKSKTIPLYKKPIDIIKLISEPMPHTARMYAGFVYFTATPFYFIFKDPLISARLSNLLYIFIC